MRTGSYLLDTSFLLALFNPSDPLYKSAKDLIFSLVDDTLRFEIPLVCAIESTITNPHPQDFIPLLSELIDKRDFEINTKEDLEYISNIPLSKRKVLKTIDCCVIAMSKRMKIPLLTFDKRLLKTYQQI